MSDKNDPEPTKKPDPPQDKKPAEQNVSPFKEPDMEHVFGSEDFPRRGRGKKK